MPRINKRLQVRRAKPAITARTKPRTKRKPRNDNGGKPWLTRRFLPLTERGRPDMVFRVYVDQERGNHTLKFNEKDNPRRSWVITVRDLSRLLKMDDIAATIARAVAPTQLDLMLPTPHGLQGAGI